MNKNTKKFAAFVFVAIGMFLLIYSWPPRYSSLTEDKGKVVRIVSYPATRYNIEIVTSKGMKLSCRENALRKWPPSAINRCPIEKFYPLIGQNVDILYDGRYIYEVKSQSNTILSYGAFRRFQVMMNVLVLIMIGIGVIIWRKANVD